VTPREAVEVAVATDFAGQVERTVIQQASDEVFAVKRAQDRAWLETTAIRHGAVALAIAGPEAAVALLTPYAHRLAALAEPEQGVAA
jgi:hypothetical protein